MGNSPSDIRVVVVGGGYGGVAAARTLDGKCNVTLIESGDAFHHKVAALRGAVVPGWEKRIRIPLDKAFKRVKIVKADVASVSTGKVILADGSIIDCDYVILAHGVQANFPCGTFNLDC